MGIHTISKSIDLQSPSKVMSKYITEISDTGIKIHAQDNNDHDYLQIDSDKIAFFRNSVEKMQLTNSLFRLGDTSNYINLNSSGIQLFKNGNKIADFGSVITLGSTSSNYANFTGKGITFYKNNRKMLNMSAGEITSAGFTYYSTGLTTESSENYQDPALRLIASSPVSNNVIGAYASDSNVYQNYISLISDTTLATSGINKATSNNRFSIGAGGSGFSSSTPGFSCSSELYDPTGSSAYYMEADISAGLRIAGNESQLLLTLGDKQYYTEIRFTASPDARGTIAHTCASLTSNVGLTVTSDKRLKEHKAYLDTDAVCFIQNLKPARFIKDNEEHLGFYAQEVKEANSWDANLTPNVGDYMGLNYTELIAPLVTYCQYLEKEIKELKNQLQ